MSELLKYYKTPDKPVIAVQLDLETDGFTYQKWGSEQRCKRGDWLVFNAGETYTVDQAVFASTYRETSPGQYVKVTPIWAERAETDGVVTTKEGRTHYEAGYYLVYNSSDRTDGYAMTAEKFHSMYQRADDE